MICGNGNSWYLGEKMTLSDKITVVRFWLALVTVGFLLFGILLFATSVTGGLGLSREGGRFVLGQGLLRGDISEQAGWFVWITERVFMIVAVAALLLTPIVRYLYGTVDLMKLMNDRAGKPFVIPLLVAIIFLLLSVLYFGAGAGRKEGFRKVSQVSASVCLRKA
jgi:hypothetical protein